MKSTIVRRPNVVLIRTLLMATALALVLIAQTGSVSARTFKNGSISVSQHEYVGICKDTGGTPSRAGSRKVTCDYGDGYSSTCDFKTNTCEDTIPMLVPGSDQPIIVSTTDEMSVEPGAEQGPATVRPVDSGAAIQAPVGVHDSSVLDPLP